MIPVCPACHLGRGGVHQVLRVAGLEWPRPDSQSLAHRLRRVAIHVALVGGERRPFVVEPASGPAFAALLRDGANAIDGGSHR